MQLTPDEIDLAKALYERMTIPEIAAEFSAIRGRKISRALMEKTLSQHGIEDPKRIASQGKNTDIRRFWGKGEPQTIAEFVELKPDALRMRVKRLGLRAPQAELFTDQHLSQ
jgi:predicted nucleic acid-binding protein